MLVAFLLLCQTTDLNIFGIIYTDGLKVRMSVWKFELTNFESTGTRKRHILSEAFFKRSKNVKIPFPLNMECAVVYASLLPFRTLECLAQSREPCDFARRVNDQFSEYKVYYIYNVGEI